mgnify:CR=1 FL=1
MKEEKICLEYTISKDNPLILTCKETGEQYHIEWMIKESVVENKSDNSNGKSAKRKK